MEAKHATLTFDPGEGKFRVRDLGTSNGVSSFAQHLGALNVMIACLITNR